MCIRVKTADDIELAVTLAAKRFVEHLSRLLPAGGVLLFDDVEKWLGRLKESLDLYVTETMGKAVLVYLDGMINYGRKIKKRHYGGDC